MGDRGRGWKDINIMEGTSACVGASVNQHLGAGGQARGETERVSRKGQVSPRDLCLALVHRHSDILTKYKKANKALPGNSGIFYRLVNPVSLDGTSSKQFLCNPSSSSLTCSESAQPSKGRVPTTRQYTCLKLAPQSSTRRTPNLILQSSGRCHVCF